MLCIVGAGVTVVELWGKVVPSVLGAVVVELGKLFSFVKM